MKIPYSEFLAVCSLDIFSSWFLPEFHRMFVETLLICLLHTKPSPMSFSIRRSTLNFSFFMMFFFAALWLQRMEFWRSLFSLFCVIVSCPHLSCPALSWLFLPTLASLPLFSIFFFLWSCFPFRLTFIVSCLRLFVILNLTLFYL